MEFKTKKFDELSNKELYQIFKLRFDIYVIEQDCIYNEYDGKDFEAVHIYLEENNEIIAYSRIYKNDVGNVILGRVVVKKEFRKKGIGRELISKSIEVIKETWNPNKININAQVTQKKFYEHFGFEQISEETNENGIPHIKMVLKNLK